MADKRESLFNALRENNIEVGDKAQFLKRLSSPESAQAFYDEMKSKDIDLGDDYMSKLFPVLRPTKTVETALSPELVGKTPKVNISTQPKEEKPKAQAKKDFKLSDIPNGQLYPDKETELSPLDQKETFDPMLLDYEKQYEETKVLNKKSQQQKIDEIILPPSAQEKVKSILYDNSDIVDYGLGQVNEFFGIDSNQRKKAQELEAKLKEYYALNPQGVKEYNEHQNFIKTSENYISKRESEIDAELEKLYSQQIANRTTNISGMTMGQNIQPEYDRELAILEAEKEKLNKAKESLELYRSGQEDNGLLPTLKQIGADFAPTVKAVVGFGIPELIETAKHSQIANKAKRGEYLSDEERQYLTTSAVQKYVSDTYEDKKTFGQQVASGVAGSIPFMTDFIGIGGIAKGVTRGLAKGIIKEAGEQAIKTGVGGLSKRMARSLGVVNNIVDNVAQAGIITALSPRTYDMAIQNMSGETGYALNEEGQIEYTGQKNSMSFDDALVNAYTRSFINNVSESAGGLFAPIDELAKGVLKKTAPQLAKTILSNNGFMGQVKGLMKQARYDNPIPEFLEEQLATIGHSMAQDGEATWSDLVDPEKQLLTLATVVAIGSGASIIGVTGNKIQRQAVRNEFNNASVEFDKQFSEFDDIADVKKQLISGTLEEQQLLVKSIGMNRSLSDSQKQSAYNLYVANLRNQSYETAKIETINKAVENSVSEISNSVSETAKQSGIITKANVNGSEYEIDGNIVLIDGAVDANQSDETVYITDENGNKQPVSASSLKDIQQINLSDIQNQTAESVRIATETALSTEELPLHEKGSMVRIKMNETSIPVAVVDVLNNGAEYVVQDQYGNVSNVKGTDIIDDSRLDGIDVESDVEYYNEQGKIVTGRVDDISGFSDGVFSIDNNIIPIDKVIGKVEVSKEAEATEVQQGPKTEDVVTEQVQEEIKPKTFKEQIPVKRIKDSKGKTKTKTLYEQAPVEITVGALKEQFSSPLDIVAIQLEQTKSELEKLSKVKLKGDIDEMAEQESEIQSIRNDLSNKLAYWKKVQSELAPKFSDTPVEKIERKEKEREVKIEGLSIIQDRFDNAKKYEGINDEIILPNGETISGKYVLLEAESVTPSHNPNGFSKSEGFPTDANGNTVNDRDYESDKDAQVLVMQRANDYDQRALQTPVVVSNDGVVLSGNDRTMSGQIASQNNTDTKYIEYLSKYPRKYGFTTEQIGEFEHPRVVFIPDSNMEYTTEVFAKFNAEEKKTQNKTEKAVKISKTIKETTIQKLGSIIDEYENLSELYSSEKSVREIVSSLVSDGVIGQNEISQLMDGNLLSEQGKEFIETLLIGASISEESLRLLSDLKQIRQVIVRSIIPIINNRKLENYNITKELSDAINLIYTTSKQIGKIPTSNDIDNVILQPTLGYDFGVNAIDLYDATVQFIAKSITKGQLEFKNIIQSYNKQANDFESGQADMFTGIQTKDELIDTILKQSGYEKEKAITRRDTENKVADVDTSEQAEQVADKEPQLQAGETELEKAEEENVNSLIELLNKTGLADDVRLVSSEDIPSILEGNEQMQTELPETIEIDGVQRHTRNSNGEQIANTEQGIRNFYKWFGNSKVVDADGRPLVVYHGTDGLFTQFDINKHGKTDDGFFGKGFYFTPQYDYAKTYTRTSNVVEVYIKSEYPLTTKEPKGYLPKSYDSVMNYIDYNGIEYLREIMVESPTQIKSATANTGEFDPSNADIRYQIVDDTERKEEEKLEFLRGLNQIETGETRIDNDYEEDDSEYEQRKVYIPVYVNLWDYAENTNPDTSKFDNIDEALSDINIAGSYDNSDASYTPTKSTKLMFTEAWVDKNGDVVEDNSKLLTLDDISDFPIEVKSQLEKYKKNKWDEISDIDTKSFEAREDSARDLETSVYLGINRDIIPEYKGYKITSNDTRKYRDIIISKNGEEVHRIKLRISDHSYNPRNNDDSARDGNFISVEIANKNATKGRFNGAYGLQFDGTDSYNNVIESVNERIKDIIDDKLPEIIKYMRTPSGTIYGFVKQGVVYINKDVLNLNTPIHEFGHLWVDSIEGTELYEKGKKLIKESEYFDRVSNDPNYSHLNENDKVKEAMAVAIGNNGESVVKEKGLKAKLKAWIKSVWERIGAKAGIKNLTSEQISNLTLQDFIDIATSEVLSGKKVEQIEKENPLIVIHNIRAEGIINADNIGGLPMPSLAITRADMPLSGYGEISLIGNRDLVDPKKGTKTFGADIYSARYPSVEYELGKDSRKLIEKEVSFLPADIESAVWHRIEANAKDGLSDLRNSNALKVVWLAKQGKLDEIIAGRKSDYSDNTVNTIYEIKGYDYLDVANNDEVKQVLKDLYFAEKPHLVEYADKFTDETGYLKRNVASQFFNEVKGFIRTKDKFNDVDTYRNASDYIVKNNLENEWREYATDFYNSLGIKEKLFKGYNNAGYRKYVDHTIENVVKAMKTKNLRGAENFFYGAGSVRARVAPEFKSISHIKNNAKKLISKEDFEKVKDEVDANLRNLTENLDEFHKYKGNSRGSITEALSEDIVQLANYGRSESFNQLSDEVRTELVEFIEMLKSAPTEYFEAKPTRAVSLSEFTAAVVPIDTDKKVIDILERAGLKVEKYDGNRAEVVERVSKQENIQFQIIGEQGASNLDKAEEATTRLDNLAIAKEMEDTKSPQEIRLATGWEKGVDGLWRYEMPDIDTSYIEKDLLDNVNEQGKTFTTLSLSDFKEISKAYPDINVDAIVWLSPEYKNTGSYIPKEEGNEYYYGRNAEINVYVNSVKNVRYILTHEIQHAIQDIEGFAKGGNEISALTVTGNEKALRSVALNTVNKVANKKGYSLSEEQKQKLADQVYLWEDADDNKVSEIQIEIGLNDEQIAEFFNKDAFEMYRRLAGEVESRNASDRLNMSEEERRNTLLSETAEVSPEDQIVIFKNLGISNSYDPADLRANLSKKNASIFSKFIEAHVDQIRPVKNLFDTLKEQGTEISDNDNYYMNYTSVGSKIVFQIEQFEKNIFKPLMKLIKDLEVKGISYDDVVTYTMLKHAEEYDAHVRAKSKDGGFEADMSGKEAIESRIGMSAEEFINNFESKAGNVDVKNLWDKIKTATEFSLKNDLRSGKITKAKFDEINGMFNFYVPLRGHKEATAEDIYEYDRSGEYFTPTLKTAKGRTSEAQDPFAYIRNMAVSSTFEAENNILKQQLLRIAYKDKSGLISVGKTWYVKTGTDANGKAIFEAEPEVEWNDNDTYETYTEKVRQHEERMHSLAKNKEAYRDGDKPLDLDVWIKPSQKRVHDVVVYRSGIKHTIRFNTDPRVPMAINGANIRKYEGAFGKTLDVIGRMTRFMAKTKTMYRPSFIFITNPLRDLHMSSNMNFIDEGLGFSTKFATNIPRAIKSITSYYVGSGFNPIGDKTDSYLLEYMSNGAKTGKIQMLAIDDTIKNITKENKKLGNNISSYPSKLKDALKTFYSSASDITENQFRFTTYITARESGMSIPKSISKAKEVTVNFDRTGNGDMYARELKSVKAFYNVGWQALNNIIEKGSRDTGTKTRLASVLFGHVALGYFFVKYGNELLANLYGDDPEDYYELYDNIPEFTRNSNLMIYLGKENGFAKIPLSQELRTFYGLGSDFMLWDKGKVTAEQMSLNLIKGLSSMIVYNPAEKIIESQAVQLLPDVVVPIAEIGANKTFMGTSIYDEYKSALPIAGYEKARTNKKGKYYAPQILVDFAMLADKTSDSKYDPSVLSQNVNPDIINHLLGGYLAGIYTQGIDVLNTASSSEIEDKAQEFFTPKALYLKSENIKERNTGLNQRYYDIKNDNESKMFKYKQFLKTIPEERKALEQNNVEDIDSQIESMISSAKVNLGFNDSTYVESALIKAIDRSEKSLKTIEPEMQEEVLKRINEMKKRVVDMNKED